MSLRFMAVVGGSLIFLTQVALAVTPPKNSGFEREFSSTLVLGQAQTDPMGAHAAIALEMARLSEIDATIAALEKDASKLDSDARARADATLQKLRATREAYRAAIEGALADSRQMTEEQIAQTRTALDERWNEFERDVEGYFATVNSEIAVQKVVFQARLEAEQLYWQQEIADLKASATTVAAEQRAAIEAKIADLQAQANSAKERLTKLQQAGNEAWSALRDGLADAHLLFDKTYDAIRTAIEHAKK